MHRFLNDDDSVIISGNELWLTTVAGGCVEDEHHQQPTESTFQFGMYSHEPSCTIETEFFLPV
jgi:hypothetical protein